MDGSAQLSIPAMLWWVQALNVGSQTNNQSGKDPETDFCVTTMTFPSANAMSGWYPDSRPIEPERSWASIPDPSQLQE